MDDVTGEFKGNSKLILNCRHSMAAPRVLAQVMFSPRCPQWRQREAWDGWNGRSLASRSSCLQRNRVLVRGSSFCSPKSSGKSVVTAWKVLSFVALLRGWLRARGVMALLGAKVAAPGGSVRLPLVQGGKLPAFLAAGLRQPFGLASSTWHCALVS